MPQQFNYTVDPSRLIYFLHKTVATTSLEVLSEETETTYLVEATILWVTSEGMSVYWEGMGDVFKL